jgi:hypothetical protein
MHAAMPAILEGCSLEKARMTTMDAIGPATSAKSNTPCRREIKMGINAANAIATVIHGDACGLPIMKAVKPARRKIAGIAKIPI